jgi:Xaa-Pro aminopeptidase
MQALSTVVRDHRHGRLREVMRAHRLDALLFTGADFFSFASNHEMTDLAWERPFLLILPATGPSVAVLAEQGRHLFEMERTRGTLWVDDLVFYAETPHRQSGARPATEWRELVAETLTARGLGRSRIGCDAATGALTGALSLLPEIELATVNAALRPTRWVKHAEEVAVMSGLADLSAAVMPYYREELRPGRSVQQADAAIAARLHAEAERRFAGANFSIVKATTVAGAASASPHGDGVSCGRRVEADSVAVSTVVTRLNGLVMEMARTWQIGRPGVRRHALHSCAVMAQEAAIDAAMAGGPVSGIDRAARRVIEAAGFSPHLLHRSGHGIGVVQHDFPEDVPFNGRPLEAGELYAVEPGLYVPGVGGFRCADVVPVGARAQRLPAPPKDIASCTVI